MQLTSSLDPYTNPEGALQRRNVVLDTMIENLPQQADQLRAAKAEPLGVLPQPKELPGGCLAAGDRGFFCDYVLDYLARAGVSKEQVARGGYLIRTTLDPKVQASVKSAIDKIASPTLDGVASVMSVIKPGKDTHRVMAMAGNRTYGLNGDAYETVQPQPFSLVGDGAGSIFKIFTTAAALDMGMGINAQLQVPGSFQARGLGSSDTPGCPKETWCVRNAGNYRGSMNVTDALATSPNTAFAKLIQQVGVPRAVDMAVRLGLRSYALPGTARAYDPKVTKAWPTSSKDRTSDRSLWVRSSSTRSSWRMWRQRWPPAACGAPQPDRQDIRPPRQRGVVRQSAVRPGGPRGTGQHVRERAEQGRSEPGYRSGRGRLGRLDPADVGQDRHHRVASIVGFRRLHQPLRGGELHLRRLQQSVRHLFIPPARVR